MLEALAFSLALSLTLGGPLGVLLFQLDRAPPLSLWQAVRGLYSLPCILVLAVLALPGDWLGQRGLPPALVAIPAFARLVAGSLRTVPRGLVDAAQAMGASPLQIVTRVLLPEARAALVRAAALLACSLLAYLSIARLV